MTPDQIKQKVEAWEAEIRHLRRSHQYRIDHLVREINRLRELCPHPGEPILVLGGVKACAYCGKWV